MHANDLTTFYHMWDDANGDQNPALTPAQKRSSGRAANIGREFVIEFESGVPDSSTQWGLTRNAAKNICAAPYGSDYILAGSKDPAILGKKIEMGFRGFIRRHSLTMNLLLSRSLLFTRE